MNSKRVYPQSAVIVEDVAHFCDNICIQNKKISLLILQISTVPLPIWLLPASQDEDSVGHHGRQSSQTAELRRVGTETAVRSYSNATHYLNDIGIWGLPLQWLSSFLQGWEKRVVCVVGGMCPRDNPSADDIQLYLLLNDNPTTAPQNLGMIWQLAPFLLHLDLATVNPCSSQLHSRLYGGLPLRLTWKFQLVQNEVT